MLSGLKKLDKQVFRTVLLNDWDAKIGQLIGEFSGKYEQMPQQITAGKQ